MTGLPAEVDLPPQYHPIAYPKMAERVLIRHTCHCDTATDRPCDDEPEVHVFEIDGNAFPWWISDRGPVLTRLDDDLWRVDVEIFMIDTDTKRTLAMQIVPDVGPGATPVIGGVAFPWLLTPQGWALTSSSKQLLTLSLGFLAREVDANIPHEDQRPELAGRAIYANGGDVIRSGAETCHWCQELIDDFAGMLDHHQQKHPEKIHTSKDGAKGIITS